MSFSICGLGSLAGLSGDLRLRTGLGCPRCSLAASAGTPGLGLSGLACPVGKVRAFANLMKTRNLVSVIFTLRFCILVIVSAISFTSIFWLSRRCDRSRFVREGGREEARTFQVASS
jgi:hypothetical protein